MRTSVRVAVVFSSYNGPDLQFVHVKCTTDQFDSGDHYEAAKNWVRDNGGDVDQAMVAIDNFDPASNYIIGFGSIDSSDPVVTI